MSLPEVEEFFSGVHKQICWSIIGGAGSGSVVSLRFGEKIRAKRPLRNPALSMEERLFEGKRSLIIYCDWRLERQDCILCSSQSLAGNEIDLSAFDEVKNKLVEGIAFTSRLHDLRIEFENGIALVVFCDLPTGSEGDSNYVMFNPTTSVAVTPTGKLVVENR